MMIRISALAGCLLVGCSAIHDQTAATKAPIPPPSATGTPACLYPRQAQNFSVLDRSNLIVYAPNDANAYHVRISPPSSGLRFAESLAFQPANARICGYAGERLVVGIGARAELLTIMAVSRLAPESLAALRARSSGETVPAAHPQPGPGADVEGAAGQEPTDKRTEQTVEKSDSPTER